MVLPKETVTAIIILYRNTKVKVRSPDGNVDFNIVAVFLQGDAFALYLFIICLDYVLRTSMDLIKENGFEARRRLYLTETITDTDYANDIVLLANIPTQDESLLHRLEQAAGGIGVHVNVNKTEYTSFTREGAISTLNGDPLKLVDEFTYLSSSTSSTESDVNMHLSRVDWYR